MLSLKHITKSYNDKVILDGVDLNVSPGEVIALIGENGAGKTTLLKILLGIVQPNEGIIALHGEIVGYVPQEPEQQHLTVQESFRAVEPWRRAYALSLVMLENLLDRPVRHLSGGQKTRLALAQVLAQEPEPTVLLLDEPTNNIDQEGLDWLKTFIKSFDGAVLLVSHDRSFINEVATSIIELKNGQLKQYGGNYEFYKSEKEHERLIEEKKYETYIEEKNRLQKTLRLQRENSTHTHNHMTRKDHDTFQRNYFKNRVTVKTGQKARNIETRLERLKEVKRPESLQYYAVHLNNTSQPDKKLIVANNLSKYITGKQIIRDLSFEVRGTERWHVQGLNGSGKSTLLNILGGRLEPDGGELRKADGLHIGYFSQDTTELTNDHTALETLAATEASSTDIHRQAISMGLSEKDLRKRTNELSRGQQAKLLFTKLLLDKHDLLILDEPTNHLDIATKERLEAALNNYSGALIVASHDRYFIKAIKIDNTLRLASR